MKKFVLSLIILSLSFPAQAALFNKKDKALEAELEGKGYAGTLPNLNTNQPQKEQKFATPLFDAKKGFDDPADLKPVPKDNPAFIDIIQKKDRTSNYVVDANELIPMMEKLADCIEDELSLQLFVTRANVLTMNLDNISTKYEGQPESYYESFKKLMEVNRYTKAIVLLRQEAVTYQRYLAYQASGSIYNPENINQQLQYLLQELNDAIVMLKKED
jgi:hypothetical protein